MWIYELILQVILIYLVVIVIIYVTYLCVDDVPDEEQLVDPLSINTGDILAVSYRNPFGMAITAATGSIWMHTGLAWRCPDTNELFVFESALYGKKYNGVFRIPFGLWLKINRKHYLCHVPLQQSTINPYHMKEICDKLELIQIDTFNWKWYRFLMTSPYEQVSMNSHYTCYEITIICLQELGVVEKTLSASSYFPGDIIWNRLPLMREYKYGSPKSIITNKNILSIL